MNRKQISNGSLILIYCSLMTYLKQPPNKLAQCTEIQQPVDALNQTYIGFKHANNDFIQTEIDSCCSIK